MKKAITAVNDFSTRRKRRVALSSIISALGQISLAEETYINNMPINLQNSEAYETTEYYISLLEEAIDSLRSVYDD
jgi:hypothetical protein